MIQKMTSHEFNNILNAANEKLNNVIDDIKNIKKDMSKKLKIMRYESEFIEHQMNELTTIHKETIKPSESGDVVKVFTLLNPELSEKYEQYGSTASPTFKNVPTNVFNIMATATGEAFYRDIAEVSINGIVKEEYKGILKHDSSPDKEFFFEEINGDNPEVVIQISLDTTKTLGSSSFNIIEFDPFLNGSYTIEHIKIYSQEEKYVEYNDFTYAGKMRIVLDEEHTFTKVEFKIIPNFNTQVNGIKKSLIGLKHIYFYKAKFETESYAIAEIESGEYIDTILDEIKIKTPNGVIDTTITKEGIQLFLNRSTDQSTGKPIFSSIQEPSKPGDTKPISINTKKIYAKIPLRNRSLVGITFAISSKIF